MKINITIAENIRTRPYEIIKPTISMEFEVPEDEDIQDFYQEKYRVVKRIWNMHLYNMLYNTTNRNQIGDVHKYAEQLVLGKEKFPKFILNKKEGENEHE
jgi:hypothetical protein